jgi:hypothetical protein
MKKAILKDKRVLGSMLERLSQADDGLLKGVSEQLPATKVRGGSAFSLRDQLSHLQRRGDLKSSGTTTSESSAGEHFASTSSGAGTLRNEERAYEEFEQKMVRKV